MILFFILLSFYHIEELFKTVHLPFLITCKLRNVNIYLEFWTLRSSPIFKILINRTWHWSLIRNRNFWIFFTHKLSNKILGLSVTNTIQIKFISHLEPCIRIIIWHFSNSECIKVGA